MAIKAIADLMIQISAGVGLINVLVAALSIVLPIGFAANAGRRGAELALVVGMIVMAHGMLHMTLFGGGLGPDNGQCVFFPVNAAEAISVGAIVIGSTSMAIAGVALTRHGPARSDA